MKHLNQKGINLVELMIGGTILGVLLLLPQGPIVAGLKSSIVLVNSVNHGKERKGLLQSISKRISSAPSIPTSLCEAGSSASTPCIGLRLNQNFLSSNGAVTSDLVTFQTECVSAPSGVSNLDPGIFRCKACPSGQVPRVRVSGSNSEFFFPGGLREKRLESAIGGSLCVTQSGRTFELELISLISDEKGGTRMVRDQMTAVAQDPNSRAKILR